MVTSSQLTASPLSLRRNATTAASNGADRGACASRSTSECAAAVVAGCKAGDRLAQKELYDEFREKIFRLALRMVGPQDAPDVLQQVFLQTYRNIRQYSGRASFSTWLYRLAINECLQFRRRERRPGRESVASEPIDRSPSHEMHAQRQELLEQALQRLDPELRAIFLLREVDGLPYSEIATALKIPQGTVGSRLNRARQQLREHLVQLGWEP